MHITKENLNIIIMMSYFLILLLILRNMLNIFHSIDVYEIIHLLLYCPER